MSNTIYGTEQADFIPGNNMDNSQISSKKNLKYRFQDNIISANFGDEIILSPSGQTKIDNLNSCLSLVRNDFILF